MIHPYSDLYLDDIQRTLGVVFDICIRQERMSPEDFSELFVDSELAHWIEGSRCSLVVGRSGQEHASEMLDRQVRYGDRPPGFGAEYWCGYVLAFAQWQWFRTFREIFDAYPLEKLIMRYHPMHEASLASICDEIGMAVSPGSPLKRRRKAMRMSQEDLARHSGASLRSIRAYEQGTQDICRASGEVLYGLSRALGCSIEELMKGYPRRSHLPVDTSITAHGIRRCMEKQNVVTDERIDRYLDITRRALDKIKIAAPEKSYNRRLADSFMEMAVSYYNDAKHFRESGDIVTAFAAVNYAHGWLDCGARIGLFDVEGDDVLFTLFERLWWNVFRSSSQSTRFLISIPLSDPSPILSIVRIVLGKLSLIPLRGLFQTILIAIRNYLSTDESSDVVSDIRTSNVRIGRKKW